VIFPGAIKINKYYQGKPLSHKVRCSLWHILQQTLLAITSSDYHHCSAFFFNKTLLIVYFILPLYLRIRGLKIKHV